MSQDRKSWPEPHKGTWAGIPYEIPRWRDPRYLVWVFQLSFFVVGVQIGAFSKSYPVLLMSVGVAGTLDFLANFLKHRKIVFPQSGFIAGTGVALLLEATSLWHYGLGALIAIVSKHLFSVKGRHIFNPSAYGALMVMLLLPRSVISNVTQWGGISWFTCVIWLCGLVIVTYAEVLSVAMLWVLFFGIGAFYRSWLAGVYWISTMGVMTGASFALFAFFMITDPRTTPVGLGRRALFCASCALVDGYFRVAKNPYATFLGLVIGTALYTALSAAFDWAARQRLRAA